eukprot:UN21696
MAALREVTFLNKTKNELKIEFSTQTVSFSSNFSKQYFSAAVFSLHENIVCCTSYTKKRKFKEVAFCFRFVKNSGNSFSLCGQANTCLSL